MIERRLQIQTKIPDADKANNFGVQHHNWGKGLKKDDVLAVEVNAETKPENFERLTYIISAEDNAVGKVSITCKP